MSGRQSNAAKGSTPRPIARYSSPLVRWLADAANHGKDVKQVQVEETHISWVFLTDQHAYKLKKPVQFDYLDFKTHESRHWACREEVRLNHRLAPGIYDAVVPVVRTESGEFQIDGHGPAVDWLVKMQRLDHTLRCDFMLGKGALTSRHTDQLVDALVTFYRAADRSPQSPKQHRNAVLSHVRANRAELLKLCGPALESTIKSVLTEQLLFLFLYKDELYDRICEGRVIEGHGDLRPEHVFFTAQPKVIDCVEFGKEFRTLDVADELAFFAVECKVIGHAGFGNEILGRCLYDLADQPSEHLVKFYESYRACVRAKIAAERAQHAKGAARQAELNRVAQYLKLAERATTAKMGPRVIVVYGGIGTGKSTLAAALADALGFHLLSSDVLRRQRFGPGKSDSGVGEGIYRDAARLEIYEEMLQKAEQLLDEGVSVVLDASFQLESAWLGLDRLIHRSHVPALAVECHCPEQVARQRVKSRHLRGDTSSEATPELVSMIRRPHVQPPPDVPSVSLCTTCPIDALSAYVVRRLAAN